MITFFKIKKWLIFFTIYNITINASADLIKNNNDILNNLATEIDTFQIHINLMNDDYYLHMVVEPKPIKKSIVGDFRGKCSTYLQKFYKNTFQEISIDSDNKIFMQIKSSLKPHKHILIQQFARLSTLIFELDTTYDNIYQYHGNMPTYTKNLTLYIQNIAYTKTIKEWLTITIESSGFEARGELYADIYLTINSNKSFISKINSIIKNSPLKSAAIVGVSGAALLLIWLNLDTINAHDNFIINSIISLTGLSAETIMQIVNAISSTYTYGAKVITYAPYGANLVNYIHDSKQAQFTENMNKFNEFRNNPIYEEVTKAFDEIIQQLTITIEECQTKLKTCQLQLSSRSNSPGAGATISPTSNPTDGTISPIPVDGAISPMA